MEAGHIALERLKQAELDDGQRFIGVEAGHIALERLKPIYDPTTASAFCEVEAGHIALERLKRQ